jgi:hypothetical protein
MSAAPKWDQQEIDRERERVSDLRWECSAECGLHRTPVSEKLLNSRLCLQFRVTSGLTGMMSKTVALYEQYSTTLQQNNLNRTLISLQCGMVLCNSVIIL